MNERESNVERTLIQAEEDSQQSLARFERTIQATYSQLESCVEQAKLIVPVATADQLAGLLPSQSIEAERFILSEMIKLDMVAALDKSSLRLLDFYLPTCQRWLDPDSIPIDLIVTEYQVRCQFGQRPSLLDYQQRFPRWAEALAELDLGQNELQVDGLASGLPELEVGQTIQDFRIIQSLGSGAFAHVYLARQESMQRLVALKVSTHRSEEPQTLSQLDHPNIVRVYDQRSLHQQNVHLLYMQAILGGTLAAVIKATMNRPTDELTSEDLFSSIDSALVEAQQQPPERPRDLWVKMNWAAITAWIGAQLADGLQSAHDQGVLHCDVKPANILLSPAGYPKLADFNVSDRGSNSIRERRIGGTLAYMSPEHLKFAVNSDKENVVDHRSDLYSLALVLWELWQGQRPWAVCGTAETWRSAIGQQIDLRTEPFGCHRTDPSPEGVWLEQELRKCLDANPDRRPQSCREMAIRLRLTLHPELVKRFAPSRNSFSGRLSRWPVLLVTALIVFMTNGPAGAMNYIYNREVIVKQYEQLLTHFHSISTILNLIAFPLGGFFLILFCRGVERSRIRARKGFPAQESDLNWLWRFGHRAAIICASLWLLFGLIFPLVLRHYQPDLTAADFFHFFLSLAVCGGIALIYPFFGISLLSVCVYYPQILLPSMRDDNFGRRAESLRFQADCYLALAAVVPLLAIFLLIVTKSQAPQALQVLLVVITLINLFVSFMSHRLLSRVIDQFRVVLDSDYGNSGPGLANKVR